MWLKFAGRKLLLLPLLIMELLVVVLMMEFLAERSSIQCSSKNIIFQEEEVCFPVVTASTKKSFELEDVVFEAALVFDFRPK